MKITAKLNPGRTGYRATFQDPRTKKISSYGLSTTDQTEAQRICNDIVGIFSKSKLWEDPKTPALYGYHPRAVAIVHGQAAADELFGRQQKPVLEPSDIGNIVGALLAAIPMAIKRNTLEQTLEGALTEFESQRYKELQDQFSEAENRLKVLEPRIAELESENQRLRRTQNLDVKVTVGEAVAAWKLEYGKTHADVTCRHAFGDIDGFVLTLPKGRDFRLGEVSSEHVNTWLAGLKRADGGGELAPTSRRNARAYLSSFFNKWAKKEYRLFDSPLTNAHGVEGIARHPENILAIRRREDVVSFIDALKPFPYWRAWTAVAVLSGPRWAEMQWLKTSDVYIEDDHFRVTARDFNGKKIGTKTGKERNVPIEKTVALEIIREHLAMRQAEQARRNGTPAQKSAWLFPSLLPEHSHHERKKSLVGQWSDNSVWRDQWDDIAIVTAAAQGVAKLGNAELYSNDDSIAERAAKRKLRTELLTSLAGTDAAHLAFGPAQWRHTFGTTCYMCGWTALEISRAMGNTPEICATRYIAGVTPAPDKRWPFKW